jgi:hypothetical protein
MKTSGRSRVWSQDARSSIFGIGKGIVFALDGKNLRLRLFDRLKGRHDFQHVGNCQKTPELLAGAGNGNATPTFADLNCGIEYDPERGGAYKSGEAEIKDDLGDVIVRCNVDPLLDFPGDFRIDVLIRSKEKNAVHGVRIDAHGEYQSTKLHCNC